MGWGGRDLHILCTGCLPPRPPASTQVLPPCRLVNYTAKQLSSVSVRPVQRRAAPSADPAAHASHSITRQPRREPAGGCVSQGVSRMRSPTPTLGLVTRGTAARGQVMETFNFRRPIHQVSVLNRVHGRLKIHKLIFEDALPAMIKVLNQKCSSRVPGWLEGPGAGRVR